MSQRRWPIEVYVLTKPEVVKVASAYPSYSLQLLLEARIIMRFALRSERIYPRALVSTLFLLASFFSLAVEYKGYVNLLAYHAPYCGSCCGRC